LGDELEKEGKDPKEEWRVARESYDRALRLDPRYLRACVSLVELSALTAEHEEAIGEDPRSEVDAASETGQQCLILDPKSFLVLDAEARGFLAAGRASLANGEDPRLRLMQATRSLTLSEDSSPEHQELWIQKAEAMRIEARFLIARGENPTEQLARGFAYTSHALRLTPDSSAAHLKFAELGILAARSGSAPDKTWAQALEHAEKALQIDSLLPEAHIALAEIYRHLALRRDLTALRAGFSHIDEALRLNPGLRAAAEVRKALEQLNATFTESK
jgi:tetratricopeptide (TPR) repeat protein